MRNVITLALLFLSINASSQIIIADEDEILRSRVDSALSIIETSDPNCDKIDFSDYATPISLSNGVVIIPVKMINESSVNEIAGIIVNQSMHLFFINYLIEMDKHLEDITCSAYEIDFLLKIRN
jgi:hypothetical protein